MTLLWAMLKLLHLTYNGFGGSIIYVSQSIEVYSGVPEFLETHLRRAKF